MSRTRSGSGIILAAVVFVALFPEQSASLVDRVTSVDVPSVTVPTAAPSVPKVPSSVANAKAKTAGLAALADITVIGSRPDVPGYDRSCKVGHACVFGPAWTDNHAGLGGHNGCGTRDDMLSRTLDDVVLKDGSRCVVASGTYAKEPYTGKTVHWVRGGDPGLDVDHVVPLSLAWDLGASKWTLQRRIDFANDQARNLIVADATANRAKGDKTPAEWMPASRDFACQYASTFAVVAATYDLPLPKADVNSLRLTLTEGC